VLKQTTLKDAIGAGSVKIMGSEGNLEEILSYLESLVLAPDRHPLAKGGAFDAASTRSQ
jgi:hypothetical protein